jgi:hypothetical protein
MDWFVLLRLRLAVLAMTKAHQDLKNLSMASPRRRSSDGAHVHRTVIAACRALAALIWHLNSAALDSGIPSQRSDAGRQEELA